MKFGSLFSGIGGFEYALTSLGMDLQFMVEIDPFCQKVLKRHFPGVPVYGDITKIQWVVADTERKRIAGREQCWTERGKTSNVPEPQNKNASNPKSEQADPAEPGGLHPEFSVEVRTPRIDLLTGGFPCQPFSCAGKRKGNQDDRFLWPEMLRAIHEIKPRWVLAENVPGLLTLQDGMVFERVCLDLENEGYEVQPLIIPACAKGAPHRRDRVWIVAHAIGTGTGGVGGEIRNQRRGTGEDRREGIRQENGAACSSGASSADCHAADPNGFNGNDAGHGSGEVSQLEEAEVCGGTFTDSEGGSGQIWGANGSTHEAKRRPSGIFEGWNEYWYEVATRLCRVDDGVSGRVERLKALGNAIVPQIAYEIGKAILEADRAF